jgi:hypothetical protein
VLSSVSPGRKAKVDGRRRGSAIFITPWHCSGVAKLGKYTARGLQLKTYWSKTTCETYNSEKKKKKKLSNPTIKYVNSQSESCDSHSLGRFCFELCSYPIEIFKQSQKPKQPNLKELLKKRNYRT